MYGTSSARDILLLAAEDAFEFERWREAGPVTADIDPEVKAAEIAEFEALGIPMPSELDSLRRELEHAPKVREAIRNSSLALRRSGRASASSLVALGPQQLMPTGPGGAGVPWGWPMGMDPRIAAAMDPRIAARMAGYAAAEVPEPRRRRSRVAAATEVDSGYDDEDEFERPEPPRGRSRKVGAAAVLVDDEPVEAEIVDDDFDDDDLDDDDDFQEVRPRSRSRARGPERRSSKRRVDKRARAARPRDDWDEEEDDDFDSVIAARPVRSDPKITWILGGISTVAVIGLLWVAFGKDDSPPGDAVAQQQPQQPMQPQAPLQPAAPVEAAAIDPTTGLGFGQAAPVQPEPAATHGGRRRSGVSGSRSSGASTSSAKPAASGGGLNPFAGYKTDEVGAKPAAGGETPPAAAGETPPANGGAAPAPTNAGKEAAAGGAAGAAAGGAAGAAVGGAAGAAEATPPPAPEPTPAEQPKAEEPKPEAPQLTKSKMTPAIRQAVIGKVGDLQSCFQDAVVGKPDLAGQVVFTISLDQDGVVKKVEIAKDEVKYGVAKCSAKKIRRWTLPSAGIPIIFDLPFDFKQ